MAMTLGDLIKDPTLLERLDPLHLRSRCASVMCQRVFGPFDRVHEEVLYYKGNEYCIDCVPDGYYTDLEYEEDPLAI